MAFGISSDIDVFTFVLKELKSEFNLASVFADAPIKQSPLSRQASQHHKQFRWVPSHFTLSIESPTQSPWNQELQYSHPMPDESSSSTVFLQVTHLVDDLEHNLGFDLP